MKNLARNKQEEEFHDRWARRVDLESVAIERYFTAPTAVECRHALKVMKKLKGKRVLDLGCGFGEASVYLALQGARVVALDVSAQMLRCAEVLARRYKVKRSITIIKAAAEKIPLASGSIDLVYGGNVLHHTDIEAASRQIKRILKPKGRAVFIEPLAYNPLINVYRKMAKDVRTKMERPFTFEDISLLGKGFSQVSHREFQLFTTLIFVWFFLGEGLHPSKVRYWKRFIERGENYAVAFKVLQKLDSFFLRLPFLRKYCWNTVIELVK